MYTRYIDVLKMPILNAVGNHNKFYAIDIRTDLDTF
jgi:hypothetical protein